MLVQIHKLFIWISVLPLHSGNCQECQEDNRQEVIAMLQRKTQKQLGPNASRISRMIDGQGTSFLSKCHKQLARGRLLAKKQEIMATAKSAVTAETSSEAQLSYALKAIHDLEQLGHQIEVEDLHNIDASDGESVRAGLFSALVQAQRASNPVYISMKSKLDPAVNGLIPRKTWLEARASSDSVGDVRWVKAESQTCSAACQAQNLLCDARKMYLASEEQFKNAAAASGLNCSDILEQPVWGWQWDGPWANGARCAYVAHDYWKANCSLPCNFVRICPCGTEPGYEGVQLALSEPTIKLGPFEGVKATLDLSPALMEKGGGGGTEDRATVGPEALKCLGRQCMVYSIGAGYQTGYEKHMASFGCTVHVFDCSMTENSSRLLEYLNELVEYDNVVFHPWCVGEKPKGGYQSAYGQALNQFYTLDEVMSKLGHKHVDIVKFDIEGFEWGVFDSLLGSAALPDQMAFELHTAGAFRTAVPRYLVQYKGQYEVNALFQRLFSLGYRVASKELNQADGMCAEFVVVRVCGGPHAAAGICDVEDHSKLVEEQL